MFEVHKLYNKSVFFGRLHTNLIKFVEYQL